jgi:hypothetical protein
MGQKRHQFGVARDGSKDDTYVSGRLMELGLAHCWRSFWVSIYIVWALGEVHH